MKMRVPFVCLAIVTIAVLPAATAGQGLGIAGRAGTLGLGPELAIELNERLTVRGGLGLWPTDPSATFDDLEVTLVLPTFYNVGVDLYLNDAFRIGGGILFKPDDPEVVGVFTADQDIGGRTFTPQELGTLTGVIDSAGRAPFVMIGFGRHTAIGVGLSIDLGLVFLGDPDVGLASEGGTFSDQVELRSRLDAEAANFEANMKTYLEVWPILSLGLRIGVG